MNKNDLKQIFYLNMEIEKYKREIEELTESATRATSQISLAPGKGPQRDRIAEYTAEIVDLKMKLAQNLKRCFMERNKMVEYIQSIEESDIRQILYLRYIKGMGWQNVAFLMGTHDESVPRKKHDRFFKKIQKNQE